MSKLLPTLFPENIVKETDHSLDGLHTLLKDVEGNFRLPNTHTASDYLGAIGLRATSLGNQVGLEAFAKDLAYLLEKPDSELRSEIGDLLANSAHRLEAARVESQLVTFITDFAAGVHSRESAAKAVHEIADAISEGKFRVNL